LHLLGDRWTVALILGAFIGVQRFDDWQMRLGIPRHTLTERLKALMALGLFEQRAYQKRPARMGYHLTDKGFTLYNHVLMMWMWEMRWGSRQLALPQKLVHITCGHAFVPRLVCSACGDKAGMGDLVFSLTVNRALQAGGPQRPRSVRLTPQENTQMGLGLRVDRWAILIVASVLLGCHYFDQLSHVLGIGSSVLARRLASMVDAGLLICQVDVADARRKIYRLTPASRDLFGYIMCFSNWASGHLGQPSSIAPTHKTCSKPFAPRVVCSHCLAPVDPRDVTFKEGVRATHSTH
jgi:DNA-binding HxlR family transcriptional regulator